MRILKNIVFGIGGGILCAIVWALMDRYLFDGLESAHYYTSVVFAYSAGYGILSRPNFPAV